MRVILMTPMFVAAGLILGCQAAGPASSSAGGPEDTVAEVDQAVCNNCSCARGSQCNGDGVCQTIVRSGPIPDYGLPCMDTCQCPMSTQCIPPINPYGYCMIPNCTVTYSVDNVPPGGTTIFSVQSWLWTTGGTRFTLSMPSGAYSKLYGMKDGVSDVTGAIFNTTSGSFTIVNSPGLAGRYTRYVEIRGPNNELICTTPTISATFQ